MNASGIRDHGADDFNNPLAADICSCSNAGAKSSSSRRESPTAGVGGQQLVCDGCGARQWRWHSCRNRHCPQCQSHARDAWRAARLAELLDVPYCHLVFTLPHELNALSRVFRGKFLQALQDASVSGVLARDPADTAHKCRQRLAALRRHDWVVYAKTPMAGPAAVLDYLSRYTHRTAIGNERLLAMDGERVRFRVRADATGGKRTVTLAGSDFIGRLLQHVLPPGFKRIRHYGLLAPAAKTQRLALARQLLAMPQANPQAKEDAQAFMRRVAAVEIESCAHCKTGRWRVVQLVPPDDTAWQHMRAAIGCRGPP